MGDVVIGKVHNTANGFEWKIKDFFSLSDKKDENYISPSVSRYGISWYFQVWPNGSTLKNSVGFFDLLLFKRSSDSSINVQLCLALKTVNDEKVLERHFIALFEDGWDFHEFFRFIKRSELERRKNELVPSGVLTVVCILTESANTLEKWSYCNEIFVGNYCRKFFHRAVQCPDCLDHVALEDSKGHVCMSEERTGEITKSECPYCKETFNAEVISSHKEKCVYQRIKCPKCCDVMILLVWDIHECKISRTEGETSASGSSVVQHHYDKILRDLKQLFLKKENCDVILRVKGKELPAHKAILIARSPVLASTFRNDMKEQGTGIIDIEDCDPSIFPDFLCFLYSGDIDNLSSENVFNLFFIADKYDVSDLKEKCIDYIKENLSVDTFCETIALALQHSEVELISFATDFFIKNAEKILVTVKWQSFAAENPTHSNELFIKFVSSVTSDSCIQWRKL